MDESIGFSFNHPPVVDARMIKTSKNVSIIIENFDCKEPISGRRKSEKDLSSFETLSAVFIDAQYDGNAFKMTDVFFSEELKIEKGKIIIELETDMVGKKIMAVFTDIFGNDFSKIKKLIEEVLEIETRIVSRVLESGEREKYNFQLENIIYKVSTTEVETSADGKTFDFSRMKREGIALESQTIEVIKSTTYESVSGDVSSRLKEYSLRMRTKTIDEVLDKLFDEFEQRDWEGRVLKLGEEEYTKKKLPPREEIKKLIRKSMNQRGNKTDDITEDNVRRILTAFTPILRKKNKTVVTDGEYVDTFTVDTDKMGSVSIGIGALRHSSSIFYSQDWDKEKVGDEKDVLKEIIDDESLPRSAVKEVNPYLFKTPLDVVITSSEPERKFVEQLCRKENAGYIDSWVKSRDQGFYEIDYSYRYGMPGAKTRKYKIGKFNPDFFIRVNQNGKTYNLVVEIKEDNDVSEENVAKYKYALRHFAALNKKVRDQEYIFHFLSPDGYPAFFSHMQEGSLFEGQEKFRCNLENALEREIEGEDDE